ncbi:glycosyltransferase family 2 protein [Methylocystis sp. H4A]|uniref:glycosyltransferase family 2 protein n=1 Tax=Methylocystis sp. H4A TaxID=2785788 RepID=UPI0018C27415|nr:glycosyltransferase family A protein [Methylocystis sp. H4A]MBG0800934.1 glycosyltransferase family 2 protein [Methylocystis sp. H4A]
MSQPDFSLVIPTRQRAATLRFSLKACLEQDFDSYEIVVCDNCSSPATRQVVEEIGSPKIVYHRAPETLCMRDNYNLAYSLTRGKYITYIGDDDSLMPFAFSTLRGLFAKQNVKSISWDSAIYSWPNIARDDLANHLQIPLTRNVERMNGRQTMEDVLAGRAPATLLPNIYHGCVAREVLEQIRATTGKVFDSFHCDTYSSFAVAYLAEEYLSLSAPLSISGFSASSNHIAFSFLRSKHQIAQTFRGENDVAGLRLHPSVPDLPSGFICVADSFLRAKEDLFPDDPISLDRQAMVESFLLAPPIDDLDEWPYVEAELRRSLSDDPALVSWFDKRIENFTPRPSPRDSYRPNLEGIHGQRLFLDASSYGVTDIAGATRLSSRLLGYRGKTPEWIAGLAPDDSGLRSFYRQKRLEMLLNLLKTRGRVGSARLPTQSEGSTGVNQR